MDNRTTFAWPTDEVIVEGDAPLRCWDVYSLATRAPADMVMAPDGDERMWADGHDGGAYPFVEPARR